MKEPNQIYQDYLTELNLVLSKIEINKIEDTISIPIFESLKNSQESIFVYNLALHFEANSHLALALQFNCDYLSLLSDNSKLINANLEISEKRNPKVIQDLANYNFLIADDVDSNITIQQHYLSLLWSKIIKDIEISLPEVSIYFNKDILSHSLNTYTIIKPNLKNLHERSEKEVLKNIGGFHGHHNLFLPVICSLIYSFNDQNSIYNPEGVDWNKIEKFLSLVSKLYEINYCSDYLSFVHFNKLSLKQRLLWIQEPDNIKYESMQNNQNSIETINHKSQDLKEQAEAILAKIILPESINRKLQDLIHWSANKRI